MEPIRPDQVVQACQASHAQWQRYLRRHGQRSALSCAMPQPPIEHLMAITGQDTTACQEALLDADLCGFIVNLDSGQAHIMAKGRALLSSDPFYWGACCSESGYALPVPAAIAARAERFRMERSTGRALGKSRRGARL